ncbi:FMN-dependent NADH-azoreductase [uncultured Microbulbifer sp.]|uniref:FMN-dependent NADH-azoreductase n=2 Tax=Microbulbifer TaxID=48073 RepID=UPI00261CF233|nr:FMN-dependent NADH-azoreductase [uncultured Microbulbifer sp.]
MAKLLTIQSSIFQVEGQSSLLAAKYVQNWKTKNPRGEVISRDLVAEPIPHLTLAHYQAFNTPQEQRSLEQQAMVHYSDILIKEISAAETVVMGVPMYNFTIPSTLHTYFDHIARSGVTFRYTDNGPQGMLVNKKVIVFAARGGFYGDDHAQSAFLRQFLGFVGMTDVEFIYIEGLAVAGEAKEKNLAAANRRITELS